MSVNLSSLVQQGDPVQIQNFIRKEKPNQGGHNYLFQNGARDAILLQNREIVQLFLDEGVRANDYAYIEGNQGAICRLIHFAAKVGTLPIVQLLVERGAKITDTRHFADEDDYQEGMRGAIETGQFAVVEYLLQHGASADGCFRGHHSLTFLAKAALRGDKEICQSLVQHGADVKNAIDFVYENYKEGKYKDEFPHAIKLLLRLAQGVDLGKEKVSSWNFSRYDGLVFLKKIDISGFNFVGVSVDGKPIVRSDLDGIQGAENAILTLSDVDEELKGRLEAAFQAKGRIVSAEGIVNLVPIDAAVSKGDFDTVLVRLSNGENPNLSSDKSLLVVAAENGFEEIVKLLALHPTIKPQSIVSAAEIADNKNFTSISTFLKSLSGVNERDEKGNAPIHNAIVKGDVEEVKRLITNGADLTLRDKTGLSTLHLAVAPYGTHHGLQPTEKHIEILKLLLQKVDPNSCLYSTPLSHAIEVGSVEAASLLMPKTSKQGISELAFTALNHGCWRELLDLLKANGADFNATGDRFLLHRAVSDFPSFSHVNSSMFHLSLSVEGHNDRNNVLEDAQKELIENEKKKLQQAKEKLTYLLQNGANPSTRTSDGKTALHEFFKSVNLSFMPSETTWVIEQFLQKGLDPNAADDFGNTLLHAAAEYGDVEAVAYFISIHANISAVNLNKLTPLHLAAAGKPQITKMLVDAEADPLAIDNSGLTPLEYSIQMCELNDKRYVNPSAKRRKPYQNAQEALQEENSLQFDKMDDQ